MKNRDDVSSIYSASEKYVGTRMQGNYEETVSDLESALSGLDNVMDLKIRKEGKRVMSSDFHRYNWIEYPLEIETCESGTLSGFIRVNAMGSVEDPFELYSLEITLY